MGRLLGWVGLRLCIDGDVNILFYEEVESGFGDEVSVEEKYFEE